MIIGPHFKSQFFIEPFSALCGHEADCGKSSGGGVQVNILKQPFYNIFPDSLFLILRKHRHVLNIPVHGSIPYEPSHSNRFFLTEGGHVIEACLQGCFRLRKRCGDTAYCDAKPDEIFRTQTIFPVLYIYICYPFSTGLLL